MDDDNLEINLKDNLNNNKEKIYSDESILNSKNIKNISESNEKQNDNIELNNIELDKNNNEKKEDVKLDIVIQDNLSPNKETIEDLLNKTLTKKKLDPIIKKPNPEININDVNNKKESELIDNSVSTPNVDINKYLKAQINEKMEKISELSISQDNNKKTLTELLQKLNYTIKTNAELLYSGFVIPGNNNDNKQDKKNKIKELNILLENKKKELILCKDKNKNYKNIYDNMIKEYKISSSSKIDSFQKQINNVKDNNLILNKKIKILNYKTHLKGKKLDLNSKNKNINDIKIYSDEYSTLMKEKYKHFVKLNSNKKLIKDIIDQFKYLNKIIDEEKNNEKNILNKIKNIKLEEEINNLKEDLSGNEENIYNKVISDKTIILEKYNKMNNRSSSIIINKNNMNNNNNKGIKKIKLAIVSKTRNLNINNIKNNKKLFNNKSCDDIISKKNIEININSNNIDEINYNELNYDTMTNSEYEKIKEKKQKYFDLNEKLDKSIMELSLFYERKIKEINSILDINSNQLSNIQQENELLKSKISDLRRILELNIKEQKLLNNNYKSFDYLNEININKIKDLDNKEDKIDINDIDKNIHFKKKNLKIKNINLNDREKYIEMIKRKYKVKSKVIRDEDNINFSNFEYDIKNGINDYKLDDIMNENKV